MTFRIAYSRYSELRDDLGQQLARGGVLVRAEAGLLSLDEPVALELVLPDGTQLHCAARVLQVLAGFGVAVSVDAALVDQVRQAAHGVDPAGAGPARHERVPPLRGQASAPTPPAGVPRVATPPAGVPRAEPGAPPAGAARADKIHKALHGSRDERNAILRDKDRTLHPFVLKNPQLSADDVVAIAKNAQMTPELLKLIGERKDWLQRAAIALALARNPKTPAELAVRALDYIPADALRQIAKGPGVLPHVTQAARKKLLG